MWPFPSKKSRADLAIEWLPRAIEVATEKWLDFERQPFAKDMALADRVAFFVHGLEQGLGQWTAFKDSPSGIILMVAAKGIERSGTHSVNEIEKALNVEMPTG